ncbi:MAG: hypothetical protein AAF439_07195 [Pseudomonadota bacterium]
MKVAAIALAAALTAAGCVAPNGTVITPNPGGGVTVTPPTAAAFNPTGRWCFEDRRGRLRTHDIDAYRGGMTVTNGRGRQRDYDRVTAARYAQVNGAGVYEFYRNGRGVYSRDGTRDKAVDVYRCRQGT